MGIFRIPITQDNTISTWSDNISLTGLGNAGASQIVDTWAYYYNNKKYLTRILAKVDIAVLQDAINLEILPNPIIDSTVTCNLKFFNINHEEEQAFDFTLQVFPITKSWIEGKGTRIDSFASTGYSSWLSASPTASWSNPGGDYKIDSSSASQYFESGYENLSINIRNIVINWLNGSSANNGFIIKMDNIAEDFGSLSTNTQYYRKSFHGRITNYPYLSPYIQFEWNSDKITDDRTVGQFGQAINLYFYNAPNGNYQDIDGITGAFPGIVIVNACTGNIENCIPSVILFSLSAARIKKGIYKISFILPNSASIYNIFTDKWVITSSSSANSTSSIKKSFNPINSVTPENNFVDYDLSLHIINMPHKIDKNSLITKRLFIWNKSAILEPLVQNEINSISSIASSTLASYIATSGQWRLIIPSIGRVDVDWQPLEYDGFSNFFSLNAKNLARNIDYKIEFKILKQNQILLFDNQYTFSVE